MPSAPDVVGPNEAAEILKCSRQHLYVLAATDRAFPPATKLRGGPVWDAGAVREYARARNHRKDMP